MKKEIKGIEFTWDPQAFDSLLKSSAYDDALNLTLQYLPRLDLKILEAGCGGGRVVKYLYDRGYHDVHGLELGEDAVQAANQRFPELDIIQGDILEMPYASASFDVVVSYGVVEHFTEGLEGPLAGLYRVLQPDGVAVITVPSFNKLRSLIDLLNLEFFGHNGRRTLLKERRFPVPNKKGYRYYAYPKYGDFFEYRLKPQEFEEACRQAGFEIIASLPISHDDGLFHTFGRLLIKYQDNRFYPNLVGRIVNRLLKMVPFAHNHMHACVLRKRRS